MMAADPFSPVAPVRLRALLLPIGKIKRSRFLGFAKRLQTQNVVRLGDVSPDGRMNKNTFSPLAFPPGMIIYDLSIFVPPTTHLEIFPFEVFREPLVIIAIADGAELHESSPNGEPNGVVAGKHPKPAGIDELTQDVAALENSYPRSLVRQLMVFDYDGVDSPRTDPEGITWVPPPGKSLSTTIKTIMCDITALVLKGLSGFTASMEDWPAIESPKASSWGPRRTTEARPVDKLQHRMTMPAQLPSRPGGSSSAPDTPTGAVGHDSPTTFDEITRSIQLANRAETLKSASKPSSKEHSRERKTGQSIGALNVTDRAKARVKGRLKVVVGSLYLQAGLWPDAIKELVEGATVARAGSDYIWHAKALESIILCLLMLGWAGMDFNIPQICYPGVDKSSLKSSTTGAESYTSGHPGSESRPASLRSLAKLLPDISAHILNLYTRAANITDEPLPQLLFSETVVRIARLLSITYVRDGFLDDDGLHHIVTNKPLTSTHTAHRPSGDMSLSKTDITAFLFRAMPLSPSADVPVTDSIPILAGMASVLSILGLDRKKAFILKEMVSVLIPGLVQARKIGAAEMGIHPAAGLMALNNTTFDINALDIGSGNLEESLRSLLTLLGDTYGVQGKLSQESENTPERDSMEAIVDRTLRYATLRAYGDLSLKIDILKSCINFCEALPDFEGVLQFTVDLLRTIKGSVMLAPGRVPRVPALGQEEQVRLYNNVKRTVGAANILGGPNLEAEYWDDFLVRGIDLVTLPDAQAPIRRSRKPDEGAGEKSPFIYNAFAKTSSTRPESVLIAGEYTEIKVTLQNPFEFEVEIESLRLEGAGVPFQAVVEGIWLAPFSLQERFVPVLPESEGTLNITGCIVKARHCRERRFPLFKKFWKPEIESKIKRMGLAAKMSLSERPISWGSNDVATRPDPGVKGPETETLTVNVVKPQPVMVIESTSLAQSAIMVLEGETKSFDITLRNVSQCAVDLVHFTFRDSTTQQFQTALQNKENLPADVYELEYQLMNKPVLRWRRPDGQEGSSVWIAPGEKAKFTLEVLGKPGLYDAQVQIDYGYAGMSDSTLPEVFYVRQLTMPLMVTVNASAEIVRCDLFPLCGDFAWNQNELESDESPSQAVARSANDGHCMLLIDIRNNWPNPLSISIFQDDTRKGILQSSDQNKANVHGDVHEVTDEIQPGHVSRVALVIPRIFIENPQRPIPSLNSGFRRQFVVSSHKLSYEAEVSTREVFWYREELLKHLRGTWKDTVSRRSGQIELRSIRLNDRMVDILRVDEVDMRFSLESDDESPSSSSSTEPTQPPTLQIGNNKFSAPTNSFLRLHVSVVNRSQKPIHPLLRLQPSLRNQPHAIALELSKRMAWTGMLQRALPVLGPGETADASLGLTIFCRGEYEIGATVEEVRVLNPVVSEEREREAKEKQGKHVSIDLPETFQEALDNAAPRQRRVWHSRVPCTIFARD